MQLVLLSTAADRKDGSLMPLPASVGDQAARAAKAVEHLIKRGLAEENTTTRKNATWREDGDTRIGAVITDAGRAVINAEEQADAGEPEQLAPEPQPEPAPRATKRNLLIEILRRYGGATLDQMVEATGWLPNTTRAAMTGLRKAGMDIDSEKRDGVRHYRLVEAN